MRRILIVQGHPDPAGGHFCIAPVHRSLVGMIEVRDGQRRGKWLAGMQRLGERGA